MTNSECSSIAMPESMPLIIHDPILKIAEELKRLNFEKHSSTNIQYDYNRCEDTFEQKRPIQPSIKKIGSEKPKLKIILVLLVVIIELFLLFVFLFLYFKVHN